jgi:hypothetical protein
MKKLFLPFPMLLIFVYSYSQPNANEEYKKQIGRMLKRSDVNTYTMKYFTDLAKFSYGKINGKDKWENNYQLAIKNANTSAEKFNADFQNIISKNKANADKERIVFKTVEWSGRVIMSPIESIPIWGPIQKEINNQIFQAAEDELTNNYKKKLVHSLEEIRKNNQEKYNSIIKSGNYEEVKNALNDAHFFSTTEFSNVDPEYQEIIEKSQQKFLQESVKGTLERVVTDLGNQQIQITEVNKEISKLSQFTYKFAEESNNRFNTLVQSQVQLNTKVEAFYNQYKTDKKALDFMQDYLYSKMNTKEKINALNAGLLSNLSIKDKAMLTEELKLEEQKEDVINSTKSYLNSAAISIKILGDLGIGDSKLVQDISEAVNIGQTAVSVVEAFTSGNYLDCISSITGLFGKKGDDVATQMHKQIMQRFDRIDASIKRIEGKIDQLLAGQQKMLELQMTTYNTLIQISDKIDSQHNEIMKELTVIENALYENRQLIMNDWEGKCQACLEIQRRLHMNIDEGILPQSDILESEWVSLKGGEVEDCEAYIRKYLLKIGEDGINPDFYLTSSLSSAYSKSSIDVIENINNASFNLLKSCKEQIGNIKNQNSLLYSLYFPSTTITELNSKINADTIILQSKYYPPISNLFLKSIKPEAIVRHDNIVRNIGFIMGLTDINKDLITWEQFTKPNPPKHRNAKAYIEYALQLTNVSIAQQAILAGDILLPIIFNESYNYHSGTGDTLKFKACETLLKMNELLAYNFSNYFIGAYLKQSSQTESQYSFAYISKDSLTMSKVVKSAFPIAYIKKGDTRLTKSKSEEGWYLTIDTTIYSITNPTQIDKTPLVQSQYLSGLLKNREKLLEQVFSISAYDNKLAENLNYLIMKN